MSGRAECLLRRCQEEKRSRRRAAGARMADNDDNGAHLLPRPSPPRRRVVRGVRTVFILRQRAAGTLPIRRRKADVRQMPRALLPARAARTGAGNHAYAGPRMMWEHPIMSVRHWLDGFRKAPKA